MRMADIGLLSKKPPHKILAKGKHEACKAAAEHVAKCLRSDQAAAREAITMNVTRALERAVVASRLRAHARRCRNEKAYKTPPGYTRAEMAKKLRAFAVMLESDLRPSTKRTIMSTLKVLDKLNGGW